MTLGLSKASLPKAILIAGPTASGKSAAALLLAERLDGVVINADSMQVYRDLRILTAQPGHAELARVSHRLYGIVEASQAYSVGHWLAAAASAIAEARSENRVPILSGGTGLYFRALTEGLAPVPEIPPEIRATWRRHAEKEGPETLYRELQARDPVMASRLRPSDPQRIVRALEVIDATAISLAEWQGSDAASVLAPDGILRLVIAPEREALYTAIDARFDAMLEAGALDEVRALVELDLDPGLPAMRAHGVRELGQYLSGRSSRAEAIARAKTETRRYAKRQMTWLRRFMKDWDWVADAGAGAHAVQARLAKP